MQMDREMDREKDRVLERVRCRRLTEEAHFECAIWQHRASLGVGDPRACIAAQIGALRYCKTVEKRDASDNK